jgi:hypothetical protein
VLTAAVTSVLCRVAIFQPPCSFVNSKVNRARCVPADDPDQSYVGTQQARGLHRQVIGAPGVYRPKDRGVAGAVSSPTGEVLPSDRHEVGIFGEGRCDGLPISGVPGGFEPTDDEVESGSVVGCRFDRHFFSIHGTPT